jgi:hypothetical protein
MKLAYINPNESGQWFREGLSVSVASGVTAIMRMNHY